MSEEKVDFSEKQKKEEYMITVQTKLNAYISHEFNTIMSQKENGEDFSFTDGETITNVVSGFFLNKLGLIPKEIKFACDMSLVVLNPSMKGKINLLKSVLGTIGGVTGIGVLIGAIGTALGWGAGVVATIQAYFVSTSLLGPIAWGAGGIALAGIATYFAFHKESNSVIANKFLQVLKKQTEKAIELIWKEYGGKLVD